MAKDKTTLPGTGHAVCVTGAGGFIASWLVKLLLERGYAIRGTVRANPSDQKYDHLRALEGAAGRLVLLRANLLDCESLHAAFDGCEGVFHTASPVTDDPDQMIEPAVKGTRNAINVAADVGVRRVVFTSSIGAVYMNPCRAPDVVVDESCWSDLEYCRNTKNWYCYAKTAAEKGAWEAAAERGVDLAVVNPVLVLGPLLQPTVNASTAHVAKYLTGAAGTYANAAQAYVHVRDVAAAHVAVYEAAGARGRYICAESSLHRGELCRILAKLFPEYPVPSKCKDALSVPKKGYNFTNQRLKELGIQFTPIHQCLYETVKSLQEKGLLPVISYDHRHN